MIPGPLDTSDPADCLRMALDDDTPPPMLVALAHHECRQVRLAVALQRRCPPAAKLHLARDPDITVRRAVTWRGRHRAAVRDALR